MCAARFSGLACDGRARCSDVCITPTRVGCTARLLRPACDGVFAAPMRAASHTYSRVGVRCSVSWPLLRCPHQTYSRRVHCSPAMPRLRWQDSLLIELRHTYSRRDSARLLFPASDDRACCSDACFTVTYSRRDAACSLRPASDDRSRCSDSCITHLLSRRVRCSLNTPCLCSRARCSDACRITHLLA